MPDLDAIRARLAACPIPEDATADWDGTNHYEIQTPYGDTWTWLDVGDVFGAKPDDYSDTEEGQLLGAVLDYACHYKRDVDALLSANAALETLAEDTRKECLANLTAYSTCKAQLDQALFALRDREKRIEVLEKEQKEDGETCSDCPPAEYPTDKTRCDECPRRAQKEADRG